MSRHESFSFKSFQEILDKAVELEIDLPFQEDISNLLESTHLGSYSVPNRLAVHPMEGSDADKNGEPSDMTFRRYRRYAEGGSGLIWFEATSVVPEGRSNPCQLLLNEKNLCVFSRLVEDTRKSAYKIFGTGHDVFLVLQLTHSGRYSRPEGIPRPFNATINPFVDKNRAEVHVLNDDEFGFLMDSYVDAARLAREAGFNAVDIKACHGYLLNDLLSSFQ